MLRETGLTALSFILLATQAYSEDASLPATELQAVRCVHDVVEGRLGGENGIIMSADVMRTLLAYPLTARTSKKNQAALQECEQFKASNGPGSLTPTDYARLRNKLIRIASTESAVSAYTHAIPTQYIGLFDEILFPKGHCKAAGIGAGGAIAAAASARVGVSYCQTINGDRWLEANAGAGLGWGLGASVTIDGGSTNKKRLAPSKYLPISFSKSAAEGGGFVMGISATDLDSHDLSMIFHRDGDLNGDYAGFGLGLMGWVTSGVDAGLRLATLSKNDDLLVAAYHDIRGLSYSPLLQQNYEDLGLPVFQEAISRLEPEDARRELAKVSDERYLEDKDAAKKAAEALKGSPEQRKQPLFQ